MSPYVHSHGLWTCSCLAAVWASTFRGNMSTNFQRSAASTLDHLGKITQARTSLSQILGKAGSSSLSTPLGLLSTQMPNDPLGTLLNWSVVREHLFGDSEELLADLK